jgi:hypothetical protein
LEVDLNEDPFNSIPGAVISTAISNVVPENEITALPVKFVIKSALPVIVPPENSQSPVLLTVKTYVPALISPSDICIAATVTEATRLQVPVPPESKYTVSPVPGIEAPPDPPDVVDQFAVLFQFADDDEIQ